MDTFRIECGSCGNPLEADADMAGKRVRCPHCKTVIQLPPADALGPPEDPPRRLEEKTSPKEKKPRGDKSTKMRGRGSQKRGGTRRISKGSPGPGQRSGSGRPRRRSNTPVLLGIGGLASLVIVAMALAFTFGKNGNGEDEKVDSAPAKAVDTREEPREKSAPPKTPDTGEKTSEPDPSSKIYRIPGELGDYSLDYDIPEELRKAHGKTVSEERYKELKAIDRKFLEEVKADLELRRKDPFYDAVKKIKSSMLRRKGLDKFKFQVKRKKPYVVFEHVGMAGSAPSGPDPEAERMLEQKLRMLKRLFELMKRRWMDPFGLSMDPKLPLMVISLENRDAYNRLHKEMGEEVPSGAIAYFSRIHTYIILYNAVGKNAHRFATAYNDGIVFHEGCHQIVNAFINRGRGFNSLKTVRIPFWVSEGLAEYMGSVAITGEKDEDGYDIHKIGVPNLLRLAEFWSARHPPKRSGIPPFYLDLWDMVECFTQDDIVALVKRKVGDELKAHAVNSRKWAFVEARAVSMIYAEASTFFLFCYEYEGGKYASATDRYLRNAFKGLCHTKYLLNAFGVSDLKEINREWLDYVDAATPNRIKKGYR